MDIEVGGVDHRVGPVLQRFEEFAFGGDRFGEAALVQRMGPPVLLVAADDHLIVGVEEQQPGANALLFQIANGRADRIDRQPARGSR
jgi:hypothetical protein